MSEERTETNKLPFITNVNYQVLMVTVQRISGFLVNILMVQFLTPQSFGVFSLFQRLCEQTTQFLRVGLSISTQVLVASTDTHEQKTSPKGSLIGAALLINFIAIIFGALFLIIFRDFISEELFQQPSIKPWMYCLILFCVFQALSNILEGVIKGLNQFKIFGLFNSYLALVFCILVPIFTAFFSLKGAIYMITFIKIMETLIYIFFTLQTVGKEKIKININNFYNSTQEHLKIAAPFYAPTLVSAPVMVFLYKLLTEHGGLESMAYLKIMVSIGTIVLVIPTAINTVFLSRFAGENELDQTKNNLEALFLLNFKVICVLSILVSLATLSILPVLIGYLFGSGLGSYEAVISSAPYFFPTLTVINLYNLTTSALLARKNANTVMISNLMVSLSWFLAGMILIPSFAFNGYLLTELLGFFCGLIISIFLFSRVFEISSKLYKVFFKILILGLVVFSLVFYLNEILRIFYRVLVFGGTGFLCLILFWKYFFIKDEKDRLLLICNDIIIKLKSAFNY